ncbi:hypothetical protein HYT51_03235 [Candidatus Woesearchaeota archaeon]|nr:hypothetical protein [Candidatus Woesearchaeota archaeon]
MDEPLFIYDGLSEDRNKILQEISDILKKPKKQHDVHALILKRFLYALFRSAGIQKKSPVFVKKESQPKIVESKIPIPEDLEFLIPKPVRKN